MATWPSGLPQRPLLADFVETYDGNVLRSEVDIGPAKVRRRGTRTRAVFQVGLILTTDQVATLETFYVTTLGEVDAFDWLHPRTLAAASFRFRARPEYRPIGAGNWRASFALEDAWS